MQTPLLELLSRIHVFEYLGGSGSKPGYKFHTPQARSGATRYFESYSGSRSNLRVKEHTLNRIPNLQDIFANLRVFVVSGKTAASRGQDAPLQSLVNARCQAVGAWNVWPKAGVGGFSVSGSSYRV